MIALLNTDWVRTFGLFLVVFLALAFSKWLV